MAMRTQNQGGFELPYIAGPERPLKHKDLGGRLRVLLHAASYLTVPQFQTRAFHVKLRHVRDSQGELKYSSLTYMIPDESSSVYWSAKQHRVARDPRGQWSLYDEPRSGSGRVWLDPVDPMLRLMPVIWGLVDEGKIDPERVIWRMPNPNQFGSFKDVDRAVERESDPAHHIDQLTEYRDWKERRWYEWIAAPVCGYDKDRRQVNRYMNQGLEADVWAASLAVQDGVVGRIVVPHSAAKNADKASRDREQILIDRGISKSEAERLSDPAAQHRYVTFRFVDKVPDGKGGTRRPTMGEWYPALIDWEYDADPADIAAADTTDHPDLFGPLRAGKSERNRLFRLLQDGMEWARFDLGEYGYSLESLFSKWDRELAATTGEESAREQPNDRSHGSSISARDATESVTSSQSASVTAQARAPRAARPAAVGPDYSMGGRYSEVERGDLFLCDPDPEVVEGEETPPPGCGLMLHPDWNACPLCGMEYPSDDVELKDPPTREEVREAQWPSSEKCLSCRAPISPRDDKCWSCDIDQGRDLPAGGADGEVAAGGDFEWD